MKSDSLSLVLSVRKRTLVVGVLLILLIVAYTFRTTFIGADTVTYAPSSCSGDWTSPELALEAHSGSLFDFSDAQAASSATSGQKIFCSFSDAHTGDPQDIESAELVLLFVPATYFDRAVPETIEQSTTTEQISDAATSSESLSEQATSTDAIETASSTPDSGSPVGVPEESAPDLDEASTELPSESLEGSEETTGTDDGAPTMLPDEVPVPSAEPTAPESTEPVSWWQVFVPTVFAQEDDSSSSTGEAALGESAATSTSDSVPEQESSVTLSYSFDGVTWRDAGELTGEQLSDAVRVPITLSGTTEIETLVVRLESVSLARPVYLDAVALDVVYVALEDVLDSASEREELAETVDTDEHVHLSLALNDATVFAIIERNNEMGLYRIAEEDSERVIARIGNADEVAPMFLSIKQGWVFWAPDNETLFAYDAYADKRYSAPVEFDENELELVARIPAFPYTIVYRPTRLLFRDATLGEMRADAEVTVSERQDTLK